MKVSRFIYISSVGIGVSRGIWANALWKAAAASKKIAQVFKVLTADAKVTAVQLHGRMDGIFQATRC